MLFLYDANFFQIFCCQISALEFFLKNSKKSFVPIQDKQEIFQEYSKSIQALVDGFDVPSVINFLIDHPKYFLFC